MRREKIFESKVREKRLAENAAKVKRLDKPVHIRELNVPP